MARDDLRNEKLSACDGVQSTACDQVRQEVRDAAAEYVRMTGGGGGGISIGEQDETMILAQGTIDGVLTGKLQGYGNSVVDGVTGAVGAAWTGLKALLGDDAAQAKVEDGAGAAYDYVSDPDNWPYLMGALTPEQREQLAQAYERGDGQAVGKILGEQAANLPIGSGGMGTIKKVGNVVDDAGRSAKSAKELEDEFVPAAEETKSLGKIDGVFETQGLTRNPLDFPDGVKMVRELEKSGLDHDEAVRAARAFIGSGSTPPIATPLDVTDRLVKVVPAGGQPSAGTGYWMRESEFANLQKEPATIANRLGLPPGMQVDQFDVYQITPRQGALAFESRVAPTTVNGIPNATGGATQTIVVNRSQFTLPVKIGTIRTK